MLQVRKNEISLRKWSGGATAHLRGSIGRGASNQERTQGFLYKQSKRMLTQTGKLDERQPRHAARAGWILQTRVRARQSVQTKIGVRSVWQPGKGRERKRKHSERVRKHSQRDSEKLGTGFGNIRNGLSIRFFFRQAGRNVVGFGKQPCTAQSLKNEMKKHFSKSTVNTLWNTQESFCTQTRATPICFSAATRFFLFKARNKNAVYHTQWMKSKIPTMRTWMEPLPFYCKDLVFLNTAAESQPFGVNASMFRFTSRRTERCVLQIHRLLRFQNTNTFLFSFSPRCESRSTFLSLSAFAGLPQIRKQDKVSEPLPQRRKKATRHMQATRQIRTNTHMMHEHRNRERSAQIYVSDNNSRVNLELSS